MSVSNKIGICSKCSKTAVIVNKKYVLCALCNHIRLHGETKYQTAKSKPQKPKKFYKVNPSKKRKDVVKKDHETYRLLFEKSGHVCEECGKSLSTQFKDEYGNLVEIYRYSHILGKKAFPQFRNCLWNFNDLCLRCHNIWDFGDKEAMKIFNKNKQTVISNTGKEIL